MSADLAELANLPEIPGYRLLGRLGRGGMGEVFLAEDIGLGRKVALKQITPDTGRNGPESRERFRREAQTMAQVSHPHIVQIHKRGEHADCDFLVMELAEGGTLADRLASQGPLPVPETLVILRQVGEGLEAAWKRGIVHRDVKPANILFDRDGNAKVADFGLAKAVLIRESPGMTKPGVVLGTPYYLSPEQASGGEASFASDIYALGIVLFEMLTGSPPCAGDSYLKVLHRHLEGKLPDLAAARAGTPAAVVELYRRMTRLDPVTRPHSYSDLLAAIDSISSSEATTAIRRQGGESSPVRGKRLATGMVILLVGGAVLAWRWIGRGSVRPAASPRVLHSPSPAPVGTPSASPSPPATPPQPAPAVDVPEDARELMAFRTGRFALQLETSLGPPPRCSAATGGTAYLMLFTLNGEGDLVLLHPAGPAAGEPTVPGRPVPIELAAGARWAFAVATTRPLAPPILLGARPEGRTVVYPHRVEGRTTAFPARDYLQWLAVRLAEAGTDRDLSVLSVAAIPLPPERRAP